MLNKGLTVLSFGGGQDSTAILLKLIHDRKAWQECVGENKLLVVMADTGNEYPSTYRHVIKTQRLCEKHGVEFHFITNRDGFHTQAWPDLITHQMWGEDDPYKATLCQVNSKRCSKNLKIEPIYKFIDAWLNDRMGYGFKKFGTTNGVNKRALKQYREEVGKVNVLIGFGKGEESRALKALKNEYDDNHKPNGSGRVGTGWESCIERLFPLIDWGMGRHECIDYIESILDYEVMPSNCMLCPFQSDQEILYLYRRFPAMWAKWVDIENRKLARYEGEEKNHGVFQSKAKLSDRLMRASKKYGHMTDSDLHTHRKTHGCQTAF